VKEIVLCGVRSEYLWIMWINSRFCSVDYFNLSVLSDLNKLKYLGDRGDRV
jgi:hypothetical protein